MHAKVEYLFINALSITCVFGAIYLAYYNVPGWGWFLVVAFCCFVYPKSVPKKQMKLDKEKGDAQT